MDNSNMFTVTPMSHSVTLDAGDTYEGEIIVANPANAAQDFNYKVEASSYGVVGDDYLADLLTETERTQIAKWITIDNPTGVLKPNESVKIHYTVNVPENAPAGGQYAAILVSSDLDVKGSDSVSVNNVFEMASILYAKINGEMIHEGEIISASVPGFVTTTPITVSTTLRNDGNIHETARISLEVRSYFSADNIYPKVGEDGTLDEIIMPGTTRHVERDIDGISPLGIYDVLQTVNYMGKTDTIHQVVIACPIWFMALVFVTLVAIVTTIVVSVKKHRKKRRVI